VRHHVAEPHALHFDATGLTKGQIYINGKHLCRYFVATQSGKSVPPQLQYFIPAPWLMEGENEIMIFDEHGASPGRARLTPAG
jgi:beta-galactosidase